MLAACDKSEGQYPLRHGEAGEYLRCRGPGGDVSIGASVPLCHMTVKSRQIARRKVRESKERKEERPAGACSVVMSLKPLTPPLRFSTVAFSGSDRPSTSGPDAGMDDPRSHPHHRESVYRGAGPHRRNLLRLAPSVAEKACQLGIQLVHVRCEKPKDESGGLTREGAARALSVLLDRRNHPIYVHCLDGVEVTSTLVACMRKVQAWSTPAILAELGRALRDSSSSEWTEVPSHLSSFLNKFGQPDGVRLPPRNHIPSWLWPAPNPLSILADPYAWAPSSHHNGPSNGYSSQDASNGADLQMAKSPSHAPVSSASSDTLAVSSARSVPQQRAHASLRRDRQLPIHHPTLKLHFETDPDLPAEPSPPSVSVAVSSTASSGVHRPATPSRPLQAHSRTSSHNSIASLRTPPHSRPSSRAGRPPTASTAGSHPLASRSASLAPDQASSARRNVSTARDPSSASLLGPSPTSAAGGLSESQLPSVAAFLEDQLLDDAGPGVHRTSDGSPVRPGRSDTAMPRLADQPLSLHTASSSTDSGSLSIETKPPLATAHTDDLDVSTPRARPTTSSNFNIGIAGTVLSPRRRDYGSRG
ncbi:hypothetical protein L1887_55837 [Cichorium endivia]|nr:hypothetical protein L1887_55837 [Cichorium endivia]